MIAGHVVEVLAAMLPGGGKLADDLAAFVIVRRPLCAGQVAQVQGNVPRKGRGSVASALLGMTNRLGQARAPLPLIGPHVRTPHRPQAKRALGDAGVGGSENLSANAAQRCADTGCDFQELSTAHRVTCR